MLFWFGLSACSQQATGIDKTESKGRRWLAGDHHIHSLHSTYWDHSVNPPGPETAEDVRHSITMKALMAQYYGLKWIVSTDHGGRAHARISLEQAYPDLLRSREVLPRLFQFFGIELNTPGGDHNTVIMPRSQDEAERIFRLESKYDRKDTNDTVPERDDNRLMLEYLREASAQTPQPVVIANHVSLSAETGEPYGEVAPSELRSWNDEAPDIAVGMEGSPGHQASVFLNRTYPRGLYTKKPTAGGYDAMTAEVGHFWDSMLAEGRRWWITATSDSHKHWTEGGVDFWPGEYSKTYVYAEESYEDILSGLRLGRVFTVTGDLISKLYVTAETPEGASADIGGALEVKQGSVVTLIIRAVDPKGENHNGDTPDVKRIDLIMGEILGPFADQDAHANPTARVIRRFISRDWEKKGEIIIITLNLGALRTSSYIRVRGTNSDELEPEPDQVGEDPWQDLWFYSNPVFLVLEE